VSLHYHGRQTRGCGISGKHSLRSHVPIPGVKLLIPHAPIKAVKLGLLKQRAPEE